jgi:hypothetical protein
MIGEMSQVVVAWASNCMDGPMIEVYGDPW